MTAFKVNLENDKADELDVMRNAVRGWYRANLEDVEDDEKNGGVYLVFNINHGIYKNCQYRPKAKVADPAMADSPANEKSRWQLIKTYGKRMGLISSEQAGKPGEIDVDFVDAIGREFVIEIEEDTKPRNDGTGNMTFASVKYAGVYPLNHDAIPNWVRKDLGLPHYDAAKDAADAAKVKAGKGRGGKQQQEPAGAVAGGNNSGGKAVVDTSDL